MNARRWQLGVGGTLAAFAIALLIVPAGGAAAPLSLHHDQITQGNSGITGTGAATYCAYGIAGSHVAYFCEYATASGPGGYARSWVQFQANERVTGLSGSHYYYETGGLNLSAGFIRASVNCATNGTMNGSAFAQSYLFWHIWVYDVSQGAYVAQGNSGYLWRSALVSCPNGGGIASSWSPSMHLKLFNSSSYSSTGPTWYAFTASHTYRFTLFIGCTVEVDSFAAHATARAGCNFPSTAASNTIQIASLSIV